MENYVLYTIKFQSVVFKEIRQNMRHFHLFPGLINKKRKHNKSIKNIYSLFKAHSKKKILN